jgi:DNA-binding NarL/FixJ family response regulator
MNMSAKNPKPILQGKRRLFLVEDHPVTREGFAQLINYQSDLQVCGQAGSAAKAIVGIETLAPDAVIVDLSLAESNGLELIKHFKARYPSLGILVLSTHDESLYAERALRAGARGYVMKQAPTSEVMKAIRQVLAGELYLSDAIRTKLVHKQLHHGHQRGSDVERLSDRELEVFEMIGHGHTTRQISSKLHLSVSTVETHRAHIKEKLRLTNAVELVRRAVEWVGDQRQ